jgi:hypothetical protein
MSRWGFFGNALRAWLKCPRLLIGAEFRETGYKRMRNRNLLIDTICCVYDNPHYKSGLSVTYCNLAAQDIATAFGCNDFNNKLANEIIDFVEKSEQWERVPLLQAQDLANQGSLCFAMKKGDPHGHLCVVRPGLPKLSQKWNMNVPVVCNIGAENFIGKGVDYAFQEVPDFYVLKETL